MKLIKKILAIILAILLIISIFWPAYIIGFILPMINKGFRIGKADYYKFHEFIKNL